MMTDDDMMMVITYFMMVAARCCWLQTLSNRGCRWQGSTTGDMIIAQLRKAPGAYACVRGYNPWEVLR